MMVRIINDAYPYIATRLLSDPSKELRSALQHLVFKDGEPRWERLEELLDMAASTSDYDVIATADQLLSYVIAEDNQELRDHVTYQLVELIDGLGVDVVSYFGSLLTASNLSSSFGFFGPLLSPNVENRWAVFADMLKKQLNESKQPSPALKSATKFLTYMGTNSVEPEKAGQLVRRVRIILTDSRAMNADVLYPDAAGAGGPAHAERGALESLRQSRLTPRPRCTQPAPSHLQEESRRLKL